MEDLHQSKCSKHVSTKNTSIVYHIRKSSTVFFLRLGKIDNKVLRFRMIDNIAVC